jgi:DNA-binding MarR family transcriptional regulator
MFSVNGVTVDGEPGLVQLLDLAQREVLRSFPEAAPGGPGPLRGSQYRVLSMVPRRGGRRLTELATVADMTKQAMGEFVADLAALDLVTIETDPADRRAKLVSLTPDGRRAADAARDVLDRVDAWWAARLGADEHATLKRLLTVVADLS